jgi:hypothetical protein
MYVMAAASLLAAIIAACIKVSDTGSSTPIASSDQVALQEAS